MNDLELMKRAYALGRERLRDFCILTDKSYRPANVHEFLAAKLEAVERGEIKRLIIEMPPRHGKSALASVRFPAWYLGKHPDHEIITASYGVDLAQDFGSETRDLVNSQEYRAIFPNVRLKADTQAKSKWGTNEGGSYTSVGVGSALTGKGANLLIIDDPHKDRKEADSETVRDSVINWYTSTARTRLEKDAAIILMNTRWHKYDLIGTLLEQMENGEGEKWEVIRLPALAEENDVLSRSLGDALWPEKFDIQALQEIKKSLDLSGPRDWLALYQQTPIMSETSDFKEDWFRYYEKDDLKGKMLEVMTFVDVAISKKASADNTVVRTIGRERNKSDIFLLDEDAGHFDPLETIEIIFRHNAMWKPQKVGIESVAYQKALSYFVVEEQRKRRTFFTIEEVNQTGDKEARIRGLVPYYKASTIHHRKGSDHDLELELLQFPQGKHDDRIDALQGAVSLFGNRKTATFKPVRHPYRVRQR